MKKLCFVHPRMPWQFNPYSDPPLGLLSVAATARELSPKDLEVILADLAHEQIKPADIYALSGTSLEAPEANKIGWKIRGENPSAKIILGGVHADVIPREHWEKEIFRLPYDIICQGEGEATIGEAIKALEAGETNRVIPQKGKPLDLDTLPPPARDLLAPQHYFKPGLTFSDTRKSVGGNSTTIISSRGCPFKCSFCASPNLHKTCRYKSGENIRSELISLADYHDVQEVRTQDDNWPEVLENAKGLENFLRYNGFRYRASMRVNKKYCNPEMLNRLKHSGCREIGFGIESAEDKVLRKNRKGTTVEQNERAIRMAKDSGFLVRIFLMSGLPGETKDSGKMLADWIEDNKLFIDTVTLTNVIPLFGTDMRENPTKYGIELLPSTLKRHNIAITREPQDFPFVHLIDGLTRDEMTRNLEYAKEAVFNSNLSNVSIYNSDHAGEYRSSWL